MRVLIQAGHSQRFAPYLSGGGGAPGEATWTSDLAELLLARLTAAGVETVLVGTWAVYENGVLVEKSAPPEAAEQYDLALCLHYDAAVYSQNTGCFADRWKYDTLGDESDRFIARWERDYPAATGIPLHNERRNPNTSLYYAYDDIITPPCVLLEHGVGMGRDHDTLYDQIDLIAETDAACVLEFLGITQPEEDDMTADQKQMLALLSAWQISDPVTLQDWKTWSDQTALDVTNLRAEVAGLTDQLNHAPTVSRKATKITYDDGSSQDVAAA